MDGNALNEAQFHKQARERGRDGVVGWEGRVKLKRTLAFIIRQKQADA